MKYITLDFAQFETSDQVHEYLSKQLDFPDFYGKNLDALHDILSTLDEETQIVVKSAGKEMENGFMNVMKDVAEENKNFTFKEGDYIMEQLKRLMSIDSPSGYYEHIVDYLTAEFTRLGFEVNQIRKGGIVVDLGGEGTPLLIQSHADTLGAVVKHVKSNGHLAMANVTYAAENIQSCNVHVITREDRVFEGTIQLVNPSIHVNGKYRETERNFDTLEVVLDENVSSKEEVEALGILPGDVIAVEPDYRVTSTGFVKSRYLDDKASVAIMLGVAKDIAEGKLTLARKVYFMATMFEEYGMSGACGIPEDVVDILCVDMGCVGTDLNGDEHKVSICTKDSGNVYHRGMTNELIEVAKKAQLPYAVDIFPYYGSDVNTAMRAGYDVRHALIGTGVFASHGYERTHVQGIDATYRLVEGYIGK